jgi:hypothetical protein
MKRHLTLTAAAIALTSGLALPLVAQDGQESGTEVATTADAAGTADTVLPPELRGLGLTDILVRPDDDDEVDIYARLPGDGWVHIELEGMQVKEVKTDGTGLPDAIAAALLPEPIRAAPRLGDPERITEIDLDDGDEIEIKGVAADGMLIEMEFDRNGVLDDYTLERDDRRSRSVDEVRERLQALGYTQIGYVERNSDRIEAIALNAHGERVEVRLDLNGRVERERMWDR